MNLQAVYPAYHPALTLYCSACNAPAPSATAFADLDAPSGTYYCHRCAGIHGMLTHTQKGEMLEQRDLRELRQYRGLYGE